MGGRLGSGVDPGMGIDLNFEGVEGIVQNRGGDVIHEIGIPCPCKTTDVRKGFVGTANNDCPSCLGRGFLWRDPVMLRGLITNLTFTKELSTAGFAVPGDLTFTPSEQQRPVDNFDRITLPYPVGVDPQIIVRGKASALTPRPRNLNANEDFLFWQTGQELAVWVEDEDEEVYGKGHYQLKGRRVIWTEGAGPAVGKRYIIKYRAHQEFVVYERPLQRWDRGRRLGQRVLLRRIGIPGEGERRQITAPWQERLANNVDSNPYEDNKGTGLDPSR